MEIGYETKATLEDGSEVALAFKDFADIPGRVSLDNQGNSEAQLWQSLQWGLIEPAHWPTDTQMPGWHVFRDMPMRRILKLHNDWQSKGGVTAGESSASVTSPPESTETS
jgi:hypothetical protein